MLLRRLKLVGLMVAGMLLCAAPLSASAHENGPSTPHVYLSKTSVRADQNETFSLGLYVDGISTKINTVNLAVAYPENQLSFVGLEKTGAYFDTIVPANPAPADGVISFAAASLGNGSTSDDVLVTTLVFKAKVASGSGKISLEGSSAANGGAEIKLTTIGTAVSFDDSVSSGNEALTISDVHVTDLTTNGGTVRWTTNQPASSSVDYGTTDNYGLSAGSDALTREHAVSVATTLPGRSIVHFRVSSFDGASLSRSTSDQTFTTAGYAVRIHVVDGSGQPLTNVQVKIGTIISVTDASGMAILSNVAPGNQKVVIDHGSSQFISVKAASGQQANTLQDFSLTANRSSNLAQYITIGLLVILAVLVYPLWRLRLTRKATN
jgi:hypothetical protein